MKRKVTIEILNIYRTHTNGPLYITIKYGPNSDQFVNLTEGDKFDVPDDAMLYEDEDEN
jgi:hypothetical protein